jgi:GDP-L-fucose synthase
MTPKAMGRDARIYVAGHLGLVGSAITRALRARGFTNLIARTRAELDLLDASAVTDFFERERPEFVFVAAAKVGGILANNTYPADFIRENLLVELNVLEAARLSDVRKLMLLGSSCIYPRNAQQPIKEEYLLTGELEPTNEPYAIAKIAGIKLCQAYNRQHGTSFISVMPTNLYGPGDNYDLNASHVIPALLRKFHEAKLQQASEVVIWGTGAPRREFMFVDDLAHACLYVMDRYDGADALNIGVGQDVTIRELAELIAETVDYRPRIVFDSSKPDGTPRKLLDVTRLAALGWRASTPLREGLRRTYEAFLRESENHVARLGDAVVTAR